MAEKVVDVVGLYLDPPERAIVLSVDEKAPGERENWYERTTVLARK